VFSQRRRCLHGLSSSKSGSPANRASTSNHRYIAVSRETRRLAYQASPAFAELKPYFEGERGHAWAQFTLSQLQIKDEIAMAGFRGLFTTSLPSRGITSPAKRQMRFYRRIADEINQACDEGRLPSRFAFSGSIHPDVRGWLPYVPASFLRVAATFVQIDHLERSGDVGSEASIESQELFDVMANRRSGLTRQGMAHIQGWAFCVTDPLQRVEVRNSEQETIASTEDFSPRPDVVAFFSGKYDVVTNTGYSVPMPVDSSGQIDASLVYVTKSGSEFVLPGQRVHVGSPRAESNGGSTKVLEHAIGIADFPARSSVRVHKMQDFVARWYRRGVIGLTYAGLAAVIVLVAFRQSRQTTVLIYNILVLMLVVIALRMALFTLGDVLSSAFSSPRYLFPVMPLYTCVLLIATQQATRTLCLRFSHWRSRAS